MRVLTIILLMGRKQRPFYTNRQLYENHDQISMTIFYDKTSCSCKWPASPIGQLFHGKYTCQCTAPTSFLDTFYCPTDQQYLKASQGFSETCQTYLPGYLHEQYSHMTITVVQKLARHSHRKLSHDLIYKTK